MVKEGACQGSQHCELGDLVARRSHDCGEDWRFGKPPGLVVPKLLGMLEPALLYEGEWM